MSKITTYVIRGKHSESSHEEKCIIKDLQKNIIFSTNHNNGIIELSKDESNHCIKVLRKKNNDKIDVVDGQGSEYQCQIIENNKKE